MATLQDVLIGLGFDVDASGLNEVDAAVQRAANSARRLGEGLRTAVGWIAGLATGATMGYLVQQNMEFEKLNSMLITAEGSSEKAATAFAKIQKFAAKTPYDLGQVTEAYIKLKNLGLEPTEEALTAYGNTASSMGKDLMQMIEAVADASTGEFERLKEFGIKASQKGEEVSFTFKGVTKKVKKDSASIQKYLMGIGLKDFAGSMDRQSATLNGKWSNLQDTLGALARTVGAAGFLDALKDITGELVDMAGGGEDAAKTFGRTLGKALRDTWQFLKDVTRAAKEAYTAIGGLKTLEKVAIAVGFAFATWKLGALIAFIRASVIPAIASLATGMTGLSLATALAAAAPYLLAAALLAVGLMLQDFYVWMNGGDAALSGWFDLWSGFTFDLITLMEGGVANLVSIWDGFTAGLYALGYESGAILLSIGQAFTGFFGALGQLASMGMAALGSAISGGLEAVKATFVAVFSGIHDTVAAFVTGIVTQIGNIPNAIRNALAGLPGLGQAVQGLAPIAPGPRPAVAGAGGGGQNITQHLGGVSVTVPPGTTNGRAIGREVGSAAGGTLRGEAARTARQVPRPRR